MLSTDGSEVIKIQIARPLSSMIHVAGYAIITGMALSAHLMPLYLAYAGIALLGVMWYLFLKVQHTAVRYYNEYTMYSVIKELEDGTLLDDAGLSTNEEKKDE